MANENSNFNSERFQRNISYNRAVTTQLGISNVHIPSADQHERDEITNGEYGSNLIDNIAYEDGGNGHYEDII